MPFLSGERVMAIESHSCCRAGHVETLELAPGRRVEPGCVGHRGAGRYFYEHEDPLCLHAGHVVGGNGPDVRPARGRTGREVIALHVYVAFDAQRVPGISAAT